MFSTSVIVTVVLVVGAVLFVVLLLSLFNRFLVKASPGEAIVKTGFGATQPQVSLSSAFIVPLFNRVEMLDLTVKTVRIVRRQQESLSCADGIRAEVEVDFYIKINPVEEDIRHVAMTIGPHRASSIENLRELFEAKFADALKTAGAKLSFDQLYQNRSVFRDEVLRALGGDAGGDVVLNGYKLDDVAIQYLEQLPLEMHNENNVLDARGRKEIAQRTSAEVEAANQRLRQKEVTIAEQNREARLRQLAIEQNIKEQEARQQREVAESVSREDAAAQKTLAEQQQVAEAALIAKELAIREAQIEQQRAIELAEQQKRQQVEQADVSRERVLAVAQEEKTKQTQIARIEREAAEAEALRGKLKMLEETALAEADRLRAEEQAQTAKALEIANRQKQIDVIEAEKQAAVERATQQVRSDVAAYELRTTAQARLEAAALDAQAAEAQATAIAKVGQAQATAEQLRLEARNVMNERVLLAQALEQFAPMLPGLVEQLMKPAEKIDSIRVVNVHGLGGTGTGSGGDGAAGGGGAIGPVLTTLLQTGAALPLLREVLAAVQQQAPGTDVAGALRRIPGGAAVADALAPAKPLPVTPAVPSGDRP